MLQPHLEHLTVIHELFLCYCLTWTMLQPYMNCSYVTPLPELLYVTQLHEVLLCYSLTWTSHKLHSHSSTVQSYINFWYVIHNSLTWTVLMLQPYLMLHHYMNSYCNALHELFLCYSLTWTVFMLQPYMNCCYVTALHELLLCYSLTWTILRSRMIY